MSFFAVIIRRLLQILKRGDEEMKRYIILFSITLLTVSVISMSGYMLRGDEIPVEIMTVEPQDMDNTVNATGKLQYRSGKPVKVGYAGIMDTVAVKNGDKVSCDDLLFTYYRIDDAYTALLSEYTGIKGADALIGAASRYADPAELTSEIKKYCSVESVYAQSEGRVTGLSMGQDDIFTKNTTVLTLTEEQSLEIPVNINETYIGSIEKGQRADIVFNADRSRHYSAFVSEISDEASVTSGMTGKETTVEVKLVLDKNDKELRAGYSAECSIVTSTDKGVIVLPYELIRTDEQGDYVFVLKDGRARRTPVKTGKEYKKGIAVDSGIKEKDAVIIYSGELSNGQRVSIAERTVQDDA